MNYLVVKDIGGVTVVGFLTECEIDSQHAPGLEKEMESFIGEPRKLIFDLTNLTFASSVFLSAVVYWNEELRAKGGKLVLCHLRKDIMSQFRLFAIDRIVPIQPSVEAALAALESTVLISCPVSGCPGWARVHPRILTDRDHSTCLKCRSQFEIPRSQIPEPCQGKATVSVLTIPTYDQEHIRVVLGGPSTIEVMGRLDLFASEMLEKAWQTVPPPRRIVFDLRKTGEMSSLGIDVLMDLCSRDEEDNKAAIVFDKGKPEEMKSLSGKLAVYLEMKEAVQALGDISKEAMRPVTVTVRSADQNTDEMAAKRPDMGT